MRDQGASVISLDAGESMTSIHPVSRHFWVREGAALLNFDGLATMRLPGAPGLAGRRLRELAAGLPPQGVAHVKLQQQPPGLVGGTQGQRVQHAHQPIVLDHMKCLALFEGA